MLTRRKITELENEGRMVVDRNIHNNRATVHNLLNIYNFIDINVGSGQRPEITRM